MSVCECLSLTVTVKKLQPVMNPVIGLLPARLLNTHIHTHTELLLKSLGQIKKEKKKDSTCVHAGRPAEFISELLNSSQPDHALNKLVIHVQSEDTLKQGSPVISQRDIVIVIVAF